MATDYTKGKMAQSQKYSSFQLSVQPKKVMLIFPPDWYPSEPYLSLPTLSAFLRNAGHNVTQKDVNLEMYDWFFSGEGLNLILERAPGKYTRFHITKLTEKAESAKSIVRSQEFYNVDKLEWAMSVFREVTEAISLTYAPARICMPPMETDLTYKLFMSSEILKAVEDIQVNVYRDVFDHILKPAIEIENPDVIGISIVLGQQLFSSMTFCAMIKEQFPGIHITIGGNTVTRLRDVLPQTTSLFSLFDTVVMYEGETAFLQLVDAIGTVRDSYLHGYFR